MKLNKPVSAASEAVAETSEMQEVWAVVIRTDQESEVMRATVCAVSLQVAPVPNVHVSPEADPFL